MDKLPNAVPRSAIAAVDTAPDEHEIRHRRAPGDERGATRKGNHASGEPAVMKVAGVATAKEHNNGKR